MTADAHAAAVRLAGLVSLAQEDLLTAAALAEVTARAAERGELRRVPCEGCDRDFLFRWADMVCGDALRAARVPPRMIAEVEKHMERVLTRCWDERVPREADSARVAELEATFKRLLDERGVLVRDREIFQREARAAQERAANAVRLVFDAFDRAMCVHGFLASTRRQVSALAGEELTRAGEVFRAQEVQGDGPGATPG
ncbi:hypothetical protein GCM10009678_42060 [Actinomadura kijaniata]|uniref:Uncharacterized protein n=1 Tax=Actinomadura namibiensis TaxID=182080 RepID=A0A7W3LMA3_ACTNM|nr:hypothetical protein [Actinomadura namibiensis]MBA8950780.1 hypothetical protein [Actinomadura namibiensis]